MTNLYEVKIFREPFAEKEICTLYCAGYDEAGVEERTKEVLTSNYDFKKLGLNEKLIYLKVCEVKKEDKEIINKFCTVCVW